MLSEIINFVEQEIHGPNVVLDMNEMNETTKTLFLLMEKGSKFQLQKTS